MYSSQRCNFSTILLKRKSIAPFVSAPITSASLSTVWMQSLVGPGFLSCICSSQPKTQSSMLTYGFYVNALYYMFFAHARTDVNKNSTGNHMIPKYWKPQFDCTQGQRQNSDNICPCPRLQELSRIKLIRLKTFREHTRDTSSCYSFKLYVASPGSVRATLQLRSMISRRALSLSPVLAA